MTRQGPESRISFAASALTMLLLGVVFSAIGHAYLDTQTRAAEQQVHSRLSIAVNAKVVHVAEWRSERTGDANVLATAFHAFPLLQRVIAGHGSAEDRRRAIELLAAARKQNHYAGITLLDVRGATLASVGSSADLGDLAAKMRDGSFPDLYFGPIQGSGGTGAAQINVISRIRSQQGKPAGFVILTIDPKQWLFPFLWDWPYAGPSGRFNLIVRDGNDGMVLNDPKLPAALQIPAEIAARRRMSLTKNPGLPGVKALLLKDGPVDGIDSWGTAVLAVAASVPDCDWHIMAKVNRSDALAGEAASTQVLSYLVVVSMALGGAAVELYFRRRRRRLSFEKDQAQLENNALRGRYDSLNRFASDAILIWDENQQILEANDSALKLFGYKREEMIGENLRLIKNPSSGDEFQQNLSRIVSKEPVFFETIDMRKNGEAFPCDVSSCLIEIDGRVLGQSFIRDATERKKAEDQIKRLNRIYAVLSRCHYAGAHAQNEDELFQNVCRIAVEAGDFQLGWVGRLEAEAGTILPVASDGPAAAYVYEITLTLSGPNGQGPAGLCVLQGKTIGSSDFAEDPRMLPWRETAQRYGLRSSINLPIMREGSAAFIFGMYSEAPNFFGAQEFSLAEEVGDCLSEALARFDLQRKQRQAELERQMATERLERAFEIANEGYWDWIIPTNEHYASPRYYALMGYEVGEIVMDFKFLTETLHPDDKKHMEEKRASLWEGRTNQWFARYRVRHKDGHYVWVQGRAGVVSRDSKGRPSRIVKTRTDISEQKLLEQEFLQSQKMESVGRLAGGVAHDFNNHLTVMIGYSQLLRERVPEGSHMAEMLSTVVESGDRAAALTRQLLAFSRKEVERREPINANTVITGIRKMLSHLTGEKVQLCIELDPAAGFVMMDRTQLEQVVMNLTVNARDAIHHRGTVTITTGAVHARGKNFLRVSVTDNGSGMTADVREHIFEPFFTTKRRTHGTGLGLSTVYGIVERSEGYVEVESEPGRGTSMRVYIPSLENYASGSVLEGESKSKFGAGQRILVVEDEEHVRRLAVDALLQYGYKPVSADGGAAALALLSGGDDGIEAAVIDLAMPGMNGSDLGEELGRIRPDIKILYASGYADETIHLADLLAQGANFLAKPYKPEALARAVAKLLSRYPQDAT